MLILLIGPKGSGKSHIGRLLEAECGVHFFHVEPLWMKYYADCDAAGKHPSVVEGIEYIHPEIRKAVKLHRHVSVETTGAGDRILSSLMAMARSGDLLLVRVAAPLSVCLSRIVSRDQKHQVPVDSTEIERMYVLSSKVDLPFDIRLENVEMADSEIVDSFRSWLDDSHRTPTLHTKHGTRNLARLSSHCKTCTTENKSNRRYSWPFSGPQKEPGTVTSGPETD